MYYSLCSFIHRVMHNVSKIRVFIFKRYLRSQWQFIGKKRPRLRQTSDNFIKITLNVHQVNSEFLSKILCLHCKKQTFLMLEITLCITSLGSSQLYCDNQTGKEVIHFDVLISTIALKKKVVYIKVVLASSVVT